MHRTRWFSTTLHSTHLVIEDGQTRQTISEIPSGSRSWRGNTINRDERSVSFARRFDSFKIRGKT